MYLLKTDLYWDFDAIIVCRTIRDRYKNKNLYNCPIFLKKYMV